MKRLIILVVIISAFFFGCGKEAMKQSETKKIDLDSEKIVVKQTIENFNASFSKKDWDGLKKSLSNTVHIYFKDSAQINTITDFEKVIKNEWQKYDAVKFGSPRNLFIEMDKDAELANAIFECDVATVQNGKTELLIGRFSDTFKKDNSEWKLVHSIANFVVAENPTGEVRKRN